MSVDWYRNNPYTTRDRRLSRAVSAWVQSFACEDVRPLVVCRGPVRKEALDVFSQMGITHVGILLSERDSIVFSQALAPELRGVAPAHVHRVRDYTGVDRAERAERAAQIIAICRRHGYTHVFAGYGFMAEDEDFVRSLEEANVGFIGPRSSVHRAAGRKDEAKRTALAERVSVTPGIDNVTTRTLLREHSTLDSLRECASLHRLDVVLRDGLSLDQAAEAVLEASYRARIDLFSLEALCAEVERCATELFVAHPGYRVRLKAIGGGGGKGQRILQGVARDTDPAVLEDSAREAATKAPKAVREILSEVKSSGVGDNKNLLLELNIEQTRHNEIQLVGNGKWCLALGGRDCSLQMHEQKLLEVSVTEEELERESRQRRIDGDLAGAVALETDLATLRAMESEAERFGLAVGLDSVSTFECIVEGGRHFFMEVNTRIQVEHRVTELCYALRFENPGGTGEFFEVTSLVEAMVIIARHGDRVPKPRRCERERAAVEARLNATNRALSPHAGGVVMSWSDPVEHELRDDQGICCKNPDTGMFMHYRLAGAYDSNVALLVTPGDGRRESYQRLSEVLRRAKLRGSELQTNLEFQYGLVEWFRARDVFARPTTRFVVPYLTLVGALGEEAAKIDLAVAWSHWCALGEKACGEESERGAIRRALARQETLVQRCLGVLFGNPHLLSAWLSTNRERFTFVDRSLRWNDNPLKVLRDTYQLLNMDWRSDEPAALVVWEHDHALIEKGLGFYQHLVERTGITEWHALCEVLENTRAPDGFDESLWSRVRASHRGFQLAAPLIGLAAQVGHAVGFERLKVEDDLTVTIPPELTEPEVQSRALKLLAPPPEESPDELVAVSGGMFYSQESPDKAPFVSVGSRFKPGDPLYMIEVMKMFNTVYASFSGTVEAVLVSGGEGTVVRRGQPLFRVRPDEVVTRADPLELSRQRTKHSRVCVEALVR